MDQLENSRTYLNDDKKKKVVMGVGWYTIAIISVFVCEILTCFGMCAWVGKQLKQTQEEVVDEQARFYQLLLNFHKEMETEANIKYNLANADQATAATNKSN